jgi:hypothetical protein
MIGIRNIMPPGMFWIVPLETGTYHAGRVFRRAPHFTPTPCFFDRVGAVDGDLIACGVAVFYAQNKVNRVDSKVGQN